MTISIWDVLRYIYKWKKFILVFTAIAMLTSYFYAEKNQKHYSEIIVRIEKLNTSTGKLESGEDFDIYEMISPNVVSKALTEIGSGASIEGVRAATTITSIIPSSVAELQKSKADLGETYTYFPNTFSVRFNGNSGGTSAFARNLLDSIVKQYTIFYGEKYLNQQTLAKIDLDIEGGSYDYIEIAEILQSNTKSIYDKLKNYVDNGETYRSPTTGVSFSDLTYEYGTMLNVRQQALFSDILRGRITKNKEVLLNKYQNRKEEYLLGNKQNSSESDLALDLMRTFAESNVGVPNSYNNPNSSKNDDNVSVTDVVPSQNKAKTTYDQLVDNYVSSGVNAIDDNMNAEYCQNILRVFNSEPPDDLDTAALLDNVDTSITELIKKWDNLFEITSNTLSDFNAYDISSEISYMSGVIVAALINVKLYILIALVMGLGFGVAFAVIFEFMKAFAAYNASLENEK